LAFHYTVNLTDSAHLAGSTETLLVTDLQAALDDWSHYIAGQGTLVVQLNITSTATGRANGGSTSVVSNGVTADGKQLVEQSSVYELLTGQHAPGDASDITINVDPAYVGTLFLNPSPGGPAQAIPGNEVDAVSVFRHELAHSFGILGYYNQDGSLLFGGAYRSKFDTLVQIGSGGSAYFVGPTAKAVYGAPIPLTTDSTTQNYYHFANSVSDPLGQDLMNGQFFYYGTSYPISTVDVAVLQDIGVPLVTQGGIAVFDTTTHAAVTAQGLPYAGPVGGLIGQYINVTTDSINISVNTPGWFIHSGSGTDAITVSSGTNVLDGSTGSNFLTGGSGTDTFFVDDRGPTADIWSTVNKFHAGDAVTIWGVTSRDFDLAWADGQGAASYTGLTLHAITPGRPEASLTLTGYASADLGNGRLSVSFGTESASGSPYMYVRGSG
jgi:hypothetical protein